MVLQKHDQIIKRTFWTPLRVASTLIVLALIAIFGFSSCNSTEQPASSSTGTTAPASSSAVMLPANVLQTELRSANGSSIKLSDYSGKVLLVNVWATWCGPCRSEIPELVKLYQEFQGQGFEIVGLSTENPDASGQAVRDFVRTFNMNYQVGWATQDVALYLLRGNGAIPQSYLIARDGRILKRFIGFSQVSTPSQLRKAVEDALKS